MRRVISVLLTLVVVSCGLAGCTSGHSNPAASPTRSTAPSEASTGAIDPTRSAPAAPVPGAVRGGTVTVVSDAATVGYYTTLDPSDSYAIPNYILSGLVTRSLTQYVYDAAQHTMVLVPDIATDTGTSNADFTEWTFTIRDGVRFEDGTPVTADDVAYGIERSFARYFPTAATYSNDYFLDGKRTRVRTGPAPTTKASWWTATR